MPHLMETHEKEAAQTAAKETPPFGPGFPDDIVEKTAKMEIWGSSFKDPGPDYCEFKVFDAGGNKIGSRTVGGY